jgi:hypothetical protein
LSQARRDLVGAGLRDLIFFAGGLTVSNYSDGTDSDLA